MKARYLTGALAVLALACTAHAVSRAQSNTPRLHVRAFAVNMSNIGTGSTATVEMNIERFSSASEREHLITTMIESGQDALLRELRKTAPKGRITFPEYRGSNPQISLGFDIHYAWQDELPEGGRQIVVMTDRYMSFWERRNQPRTVDYPFTLIEMHVDAKGEGSGRMAVATKISFNKDTNVIELEHFASEPVRLTKIEIAES